MSLLWFLSGVTKRPARGSYQERSVFSGEPVLPSNGDLSFLCIRRAHASADSLSRTNLNNIGPVIKVREKKCCYSRVFVSLM